jgi:hypothetical protein
MKIYTLVALLLASSALADETACGPAYPDNLPCLPGVVSVRVGEFPALAAKYVVVFYEKPLDDLYADFTQAAREAGWDVAERQVGDEPGGVRYRSQLTKDGAMIGFSVYTLQGRSLIQLVVFNRDPR